MLWHKASVFCGSSQNRASFFVLFPSLEDKNAPGARLPLFS